MEMIISHNGRNWVAENETLKVSAPTLELLDVRLAEKMRACNLVGQGQVKKVFMAFNNATIPQWIRQYAQHYFNRIVEVKG